MIYLDNAATSYRKPFSVITKDIYATIYNSANAGRGGHKLSIDTMEKVYGATTHVAELFNINNPENIAYTNNATLALNMAIGGVLKNGGHAIITQMEHNSVLRPVNFYGNYTIIPADEKGYVNPVEIESAIKYDTRLIVCTHASNVCGSIQPVKQIGEIAKKYGIIFLVDAAQTAGCYPIDVKEINADLLAFSGHKGLMGPLGTGGIYVKPGVELVPIISGGTGSHSESILQPNFMPDMLQSGTINAPGVIALGEACKFIKKYGVQKIHEKETELARILIEDLSIIKGIEIYGKKTNTDRNGTVAFNVHGIPSTTVSEILDKKYSIALRAGFHCAPLAHKALKTGDSGCVRVSFGFFNKKSDEKRLVKALNLLAF